jgi:hypothetical protein
MPTRTFARFAPAALLCLALLAGCYETEKEVGPADQAKVDPRLVGDWEFRDTHSGATLLTVRNFDGRQYYLEWSSIGEEPHRASAYVAEAGGAAFAHVRELTPDGALAPKHSLLRVSLTPDGRIALRFLNDKFFEPRDVSTSQKLRSIVEHNAGNDAMYDDETFYGFRKSA